MGWPTRTPDQVLSGSAAKTLAQDLYDRALTMAGKAWGVPVVSTSTASAAYVTIFSRKVRIPPYVRSGQKLRFYALGTGGGGGTLNLRLSEAGGTVGTVATTGGTGVTVYTELTVPDDTWAGAIKTLVLEYKTTTGGTATVSTSGFAGNLLVVYP